MEDDGDEFDEVQGGNLDLDVANNITAEAYLGRRRANGGGITKRDLLCQYIAEQP